ncbi:MAG: hypothetical protein K8S99_04980 [Planctomycetes bacterium]|nr:hypothetical protein [Planctomycetota bacterium]
MPRRRTPNAPTPCLEALEPRALLSAPPVTFTDAHGTAVTVKLTGNGAINLVPVGNDFSIQLTGTDQGSSLKITGKGGDGRVRLVDISTDGAMKSISGSKTDLVNDLTVGGNIRTLTLGDLLAGTEHTLSIGGTAAAKSSTITLGRVTDLTLTSGAPVKTLKVTDWDDTGSDDHITAPVLQSVSSKEDFAAGATLSDPNYTKALLGALSVKGALSGTWSIDSDTGNLSAGSVSDGFSMSAAGLIKKVTIKGAFSGVMAGTDIGAVSIGGDVTDARLLAGADLGDDAKLGGAGDNTDLFFAGTLKSLSIKGQVFGSVFGVGLDPVNGTFNDGDDIVTGKSRSTAGTISVKGAANGTSLFAAGLFKKKVTVTGTRIEPAGDPRFLLASIDPDDTPPVIVAQLKNDTGTDGDGTTSDPTMIGRVTDLGTITSLRLGIDDDELTDFDSILSLLEPNGTFELLRSRIEQVNGGPLTAGEHTLNFIAKDDAGNSSAFYAVTFTFQP